MLKPAPPLKPSRQQQMIVLVFAPPLELDLQSWGGRLVDGTIAMPEVEVVNEYGSIYNLNSPTFIGNTERAFSKSGPPTDRVYVEVRMRSDHPNTSQRVIWRCHNMK